jgi:geranylgeranyl transferase type-2 subunit beta
LAAGAEGLPESLRTRHAAYLAGTQRDDGGFSGRRGTSDPYYTSFGLRGLAMLGALSEEAARRAAAFLRHRLGQPMPSVEFISLVTSAALVEMAVGEDVFADAGLDRQSYVIEFLDRFRRSDGGYAKTERSGQASTYHTFLATACKEIVAAPPDEVEPMIALVHRRRRDDGGFVEIDVMRDSGTNPTAAAVGLLTILGGLDEPRRASAANFLAQMQTAEGGFRANSRLPVADLLSTFTSLVALGDLQSAASIDTAAVRRFVDALEEPAGGFRAGAWDDAVDVEYTFYGLGVLALLAAAETDDQ